MGRIADRLTSYLLNVHSRSVDPGPPGSFWRVILTIFPLLADRLDRRAYLSVHALKPSKKQIKLVLQEFCYEHDE
jgi:hypothetical protein